LGQPYRITVYIDLGRKNPTLTMNLDVLEKFAFGYAIDCITKGRIFEDAVPRYDDLVGNVRLVVRSDKDPAVIDRGCNVVRVVCECRIGIENFKDVHGRKSVTL
jgi:hypothetical protein